MKTIITQVIPSSRTIVLDAMGVLYPVRDDVADLLVPFIKSEGGCSDALIVERFYLAASVGEITSNDFWSQVGLSVDVEDRYLEGFELSSGVFDFLAECRSRGFRIACLSNDVSEWSLKLRQHFKLEGFISDWIISGDVGVRKPNARIYEILIRSLNVPADTIIFVDDRLKNVVAAEAQGITSILFAAQEAALIKDSRRTVHSFVELGQRINVL